jgi:glycosyltransferase involved in cell wall biosynthesis/ribosomal protein S18 acetylase RimI-like enzyme
MMGSAPATRPDGEPVRVAHIATIDMTHRFLLIGQLRRLRDEGFAVAAISAPGRYAAELEAEGIRHIPWTNATRSWNPGADLRALRELLDIMRRERFDIVHTHNPKPGILGRFAGRIAGCPVVVNTVHGFWATPDDRPGRRLPVMGLEWLAARCSDLELYQSAEDLTWARRSGLVSTRRSRLLGNGTDLSRFDPSAVSPSRLEDLRRGFDIPLNAPVIGTMGRMVGEKGYREFFTAAREIRRVMPEARFLVMGETDATKPDAIRSDEVAAVSGDVIFSGWRSDVPDVLALMDVFVLASWREGMPRSAIEAAAMAKPLILTDIRGCREVVRPGIEGLLVRPRDSGELVAAITSLLRDSELRNRLGSAARARAVERFDERRVASTVVGAYATLLARKGVVGKELSHEGLRSVLIRRARTKDIPALARLHAEVLPTAFLPLLGQRFLRRFLRALVEDPGAVVVVAERHEELIGYAGGVLSPAAFRRRFLRRHGVQASLVVAPRLLRPGMLRRVREITRYPEITSGFPQAEWTLVGVRRGTAPGLGPQLGHEVLTALGKKGADQVKGYVAADNRAMNAMVRRMGFRLAGQVSVHDGRVSNIWVIRSPSLVTSS